MQYRKYILLLFISGLFCQSLFNRIFPESYYIGDARSMAIGHSYLTFGSSSKLILSNPAKISRLGNQLDFHINLSSLSERRSRIIRDNWGEFLAETDYAFNKNNYLSESWGLIHLNSRNSNKINSETIFAFGYHYSKLYSFNYNYEEEVRSDADLEDGIVGIDDPIIGFHTYHTEGDVGVHSIALSMSNLSNYALGFTVNKINSQSKLNDYIYVNVIDPGYYANNNIAIAQDINNTYKIDSDYFYTVSLDVFDSNFEMTIAAEQGLSIETIGQSVPIQISNHTGLPLFFAMNSNNELEYLIAGLNQTKINKYHFGLLFKPQSKNLSFAFETTQEWINIPLFGVNSNSNNIQYSFDAQLMEFRFGFEYARFKSFPIRAGLVYSESILTDPKTTITLGTGKKFGKFVTLDLALDYSTVNYNYYDLFPEQDIFNMSCELVQCDKVTENKLNILTTMKVNF
mgnify:FL=1